MKNIKTLLFGLLFFLSSASSSFASHIVGGEINYSCLGNDQYEITIIVYRDSVNGNPGAFFDDPIALGIFDPQTGAHLSTEYFVYQGHTAIQMPAYLSNYAPVSNLGFQRAEYRKIISLPFSTNGYQLTYQRCCRNSIISNIVDPISTGFTITTIVTPTALTTCNNSPIAVLDVPLFLCVYDTFMVDMSAVDAEGDSLSYGFYTPFDGANTANPMPQPPVGPPYAPFNWLSPHSQNNQVPDVTIDNVTGILSGYRGTTGYYAMGVYINEYRNGQLISTTYRDYSLTLVPCNQLIPSGVEQIASTLQVTVSPNPVFDILNIQIEKNAEVSLSLYSLLGQELINTTFIKNTQLDISELPQGLYMINLKSGNEQFTQKIIKK